MSGKPWYVGLLVLGWALSGAPLLGQRPGSSAEVATPATRPQVRPVPTAVLADDAVIRWPRDSSCAPAVPSIAPGSMRPVVPALPPQRAAVPEPQRGDDGASLGGADEHWDAAVRDVRAAADVALAELAAPNCTRVWVAITPRELQVGLLAFGDNAFLAPPGYEPGTGHVLIHVDVDGKPAPNQTVTLEVRSIPNSGGHAHLLTQDAPTAWLDRYSVATDANGDAKVKITAGYRGGTEYVVAAAVLGGKRVEYGATVRIRHPNLRDIWTMNGSPGVSPRWPFVYIGETTAHPKGTNHYFQEREINKLMYILISAHERMTALKLGKWGKSTLCIMRMNDASLPDGGRFGADYALPNTADAYRPVGGAPSNKVAQDPNPDRSHKRHDRGLSLDLDRLTVDGCALDYTILGAFAEVWGGVVYDEGGHAHVELPDPRHPAYVGR